MMTISTLTLTLLHVASCTADGPLAVAVGDDVAASTTVVNAQEVTDLAVVDSSTTTLTLSWTQVDDGAGEPAWYNVRYGSPALDWDVATVGCGGTIKGDAIGATISCVIEGLDPGASYEVQLMSYGRKGGKWKGAAYSNVVLGRTTSPVQVTDTTETTMASPVEDLSVAAVTESTLTVRWTQVDDGTGQPAKYRVKYAVPPIDWQEATTACTTGGEMIGAELTCEVAGLASGTTYDVQLMSYRTVDGVWQGAVYSNIATGETADRAGIWIGPAEIAALPTSGDAWNNVFSAAQDSCGSVDLTDNTDATNVCIMAKALVYARTDEATYAEDVLTAIREIVNAPTYDGRALALGRELGAYVIAADLIDLSTYDPALDELFRTELTTLRTTYTWGAASNLIDCHEKRPNNWGAHCGATRAAIAVYLGDTADLERTAQVLKGYLGDRSSYAGFAYGGPNDDLSWQCDPERPVGINPVGCERDGLSIDGVLPDDQRRGGSFTTSPPKENYVWEALQGLLAQAVILYRAGYPVWDWEDRALLRAVEWLHGIDYPAEGDDTWEPHIVNYYYGTSFPAPTPARPGKNVGWTDWTHG
jgi:hypothetical protein